MRSGVFTEELATNYDESRSLGEEGAGELTRQLAAELRGRGPVLEVGVGTGRMALPLAQAGIPIVGLEPSTAMLARLLQNAGGRPTFALLRADGLHLPFADGAVGATMFCHVLHLIPDWRGALREAARVLREEGEILIEGSAPGEWRDGVRRQLRRHFRDSIGFTPPPPIGVRDQALVDATLAQMGWDGRALPPVVATEQITLGRLIDRMERGLSSSEQSIPPAERRRGWAETRRWAEAELGSLEQMVEARQGVVWHVYRRAG